MRSNLKICFLIAILAIAIAPILAQVVWSGGVSITDRTDLAAISSTCNASRYGRPVGATDTSMGLQAVAPAHPSMSYEASLSTVGIPTDKIVDVILTPDGGVTAWSPKFVKGQGYTISLPLGNTMIDTRCKILQPKKNARDKKDVWVESVLPISFAGLTPGKMAKLEWKLAVRDGRRTITIVFVPLTFSFTRQLSVGFSFMVQQALPDFDRIPNSIEGDHVVFSYLRGFIPAWASPDPAELLRQKMVKDIIGSQIQPSAGQPNPSAAQPPCQPQPDKPPCPQPQAEGKTSSSTVNMIGRVKVETKVETASEYTPNSVMLNVYIWKDKDNKPCPWLNRKVDIGCMKNPLAVEFWRVTGEKGKFKTKELVAKGLAFYRENGNCVEIYLEKDYDFPLMTDDICTSEGGDK